MSQETSHSVRIRKQSYLKLWDLQVKLMRECGTKTSLQTLLKQAIDKLVEDNRQ